MNESNPTERSLIERRSERSISRSAGGTQRGDFVWSLRGTYSALCRFRRRGFVFFAGTIVLVCLGLMVCPRTYRSEAQLFVRLGRENATLDPTATTGPVVGLNVTRESEIKSIIEVISSRELVEQIGFQSPVTSGLGREKAITSLMKDIHVWSPRQTTVIGIEAKAKSAERARDIVKTLVDVYLDEHLRLNRTPRAYEFFDEQTTLLSEQLDKASQELRDAKSKFNVASIEGRRDALQAQTSAVETQLLETASAMTASLAKTEAQRESMKLLPDQMLKHIAGQSVAADAMQQRLHELLTQEQELLAKYSERHPAVISIRQHVREAKLLALEEQPNRGQTVTGALLQEDSNYRSLQAREQALKRQLNELHDKLSVLNEQELEVREHERRVQIAETNYFTYVTSLEETRVDQALQDEEISNISIVQQASVAQKPISPKKGRTLALALLVATIGGLSIPLLSAQLDHSLKSREDIESWLAAPMLASIPRTSPNSLAIGHILSGTRRSGDQFAATIGGSRISNDEL
jgi:uncharacterized protein involved in exopolysaccharide biosynthesis